MPHALKINNCEITFKLDTGAEFNVLPYNDFLKVKEVEMLVPYSGLKMEPKGSALLQCDEFQLEFQIAETISPAILGSDACSNLELIKSVHNIGKNKKQN